MNVVARLIGMLAALVVVGSVVASVVAAVAAHGLKRRIVRVDDPDGDEIHLAAIFEPLSFTSHAAAFRGGTIDLWYGGGIVDLRDATLDPAGASLHLRAIFGGCQLIVPEDWPIVLHPRGIGGIGDGRARVQRALDAPTLTIDGVVLFGGCGITSELPEATADAVNDAIARRSAAGNGIVTAG